MIDYAGQGYMSAGLKLVLKKVFNEIELHWLEANTQAENVRSINWVKSNGFRKEGYSPRHFKINGKWCDHERWAITREEFVANENINDIAGFEIFHLSENDIDDIVLAFENIGWNKPRSIYEACLNEQSQDLRSILIVKNKG